MPIIPYPNVPNVAGVPAIPRSPLFPPVTTVALGTIQSFLWRVFRLNEKWGIYDSAGNALGNPASFTGLIGDALESAGYGSTLSTGAIEYRKESMTSDFPVERGGFASYNKVERPAMPVVTLCFSGNKQERTAFLAAIDSASKSTQLYSVATPEITYINYSVDDYNYQRRSVKGATLLIVEIRLKEIREISVAYSKSQINDPKSASSMPQVDNGKVQGQIPATSTLKSLANKLSGLADSVKTYLQNSGK